MIRNLLRMPTEVDILAIGVHPDDIELSCSGTLLNHIQKGYSIGLLDLTLGELGTRGTASLRTEEAFQAAQKLSANFRVQLDLEDGFFNWNKESILKIIQVIRAAKPRIIFANAISDRHPDHGRAAKLVSDAIFYAGLEKIITIDQHGKNQIKWRPKHVLHYVQDHQLEADIICDISSVMNEKLEIIQCFKSQFYDPNSTEPVSPISGKDFFDVIKAKNKTYGRSMNVEYAEAFNFNGPIPLNNLIESLI
ncbi:MAG: bacillithiol biosynthesis deacetylase BshB1 [Saprospiraceae bacterium]